ncbi:MAG TPA: carboxypeptidase regulatory-like domain-containing protein, partial [Methylomirabilota bacterium]|nr:carboxypeptidase regulatory-like domain-containing protein [Methylomirabilota bacterium]
MTVSGSASNGVNFAVTTKLAIISVNGGASPTAGNPFPVVVQSQDADGNPANVNTATDISLSLKTGTGILGGTLTGTIAAATNQVTLSLVTYTKAESGVVITAARTSGNNLSSGDSAAFTVSPGAASTLVFANQPGNATAGASIPGPPTVTVRDSFGNTVTSSTASITVAIGSNPGGGILSGTTTRNASSGVAAFAGLSINEAGNGYTLLATSSGLTSATSSAFNVTSTGGTIAGVITRYSNGTAISGALVEAIQGGSVVASAITNGSGSYLISGLSAGAYTVRASSVGFVPQILTGVTVSPGGTATVNLSLNVGIAIHSPVAGAQINDHTALVSGMFDTSLGEVGINVNGYVALQDGDEFALIVPLEATTTSLTATVTSTGGTTLASHTIPIAVQTPATVPVLNFRPSPVVAFVGEAVTFHLTSQNAMSQVQLDGNGDGTIDFTGPTLDGVSVTFAEPGLYYPTVVVTEPDATTRSATTLVQVLDMIQLDAMLVIKWNAMK